MQEKFVFFVAFNQKSCCTPIGIRSTYKYKRISSTIHLGLFNSPLSNLSSPESWQLHPGAALLPDENLVFQYSPRAHETVRKMELPVNFSIKVFNLFDYTPVNSICTLKKS